MKAPAPQDRAGPGARHTLPRREVRIIAIGGASASGKSTVASELNKMLSSPIEVLTADGFGAPVRCTLQSARSKCLEEPSSVDWDLLVSQIQAVVDVLGDPAVDSVPDIVIQRRPHKGPLSVAKDRVGKYLGPGPVYVILEGFLLFVDRRICAMVDAAVWLDMAEATGAQRRYEREGRGVWDVNDSTCKEYATGEGDPAGHNYMHVWKHHLINMPVQKNNLGSKLVGTIEASAVPVAEVVTEALRLLSSFLPPGPGLLAHVGGSPVTTDGPLTRTGEVNVDVQSTSMEPMADVSIFESFQSVLGELPAGSKVAVLCFRGSFCPVTLAHVQCLLEARDLLLGVKPAANSDLVGSSTFAPYDACLALVQANSDGWLEPKLAKAGDGCISRANREMLLSAMATVEARWIQTLSRVGDGFNPSTEDTHFAAMAHLASLWPQLQFVTWWLNGADDVVKYKKWETAASASRLITMGRPGDTEAIVAALRETPLPLQHFLLGPEMADVSSTMVRKMLRTRDDDALDRMLHPSVKAWCYDKGPYQPTATDQSRWF